MENTQEKFYIRWWGCASVEIAIADINLVIDPYVCPDEPIYDYIFCTQEHFDHFHRETLLKLCKGPRFKKLIVNIGCVSPGQPIEKVTAETERDRYMTAEEAKQYGLIDEVLQFEETDKPKEEDKKP